MKTNDNNNKLKNIFQFIIEIFIIGGLVFYFYNNSEEFYSIFKIQKWDLVKIVSLCILVLLLYSAQLKQMVLVFDISN